jgi:alpha-amylase
MQSSTLVLFVLISTAIALSPAEWRSQSIYQIVTDRFARTDNSTTANCDPRRGLYCGGTWQGIINKLDYIQGMGFTAVCPTELLPSWADAEGLRYGFLLS